MRKRAVILSIFLILLTCTSLAAGLGSEGVSAAANRPYGSPFPLKEHAFIPRLPGLTGISPPLIAAPVGLASYGTSGSVSTNSVLGSMTIKSLDLGLSAFPNGTVFTNASGAIIVDAVLWIPGHGVYWVQNALFLYTPNASLDETEFLNNVWNFTSATNAPLKSSDISGNGVAQAFTPREGYYYYVDPTVFNLTLPYTVNITMNLVPVNGAAGVQFGYSIRSGNGKEYTGTYDTVTFFPHSQNANPYIRIGGFAPNGLESDLEYVLVGPGGGSYVFVNGVNAVESLYYGTTSSYTLGSGKGYTPVKDGYSYGTDIAEASVLDTSSRLLNPTGVPEAVIGPGSTSLYQLWPTEVASSLSYSSNYGAGSVQLSGELSYPTYSSGVPEVPVAGMPVELSVNGQPVANTTTGPEGAFTVSWQPNSTGIYSLDALCPGSTAFLESSQQLRFVVSSLNITGAPGANVTLQINSTIFKEHTGSVLYIPVPSGSSLVLTAARETSVEPGTRTVLTGLGAVGSISNNSVFTGGPPLSTVVIGGQLPEKLQASYVTQYYVSVSEQFGQNISAWYDSGSTVSFSAPSSVTVSSGSIWTFGGWQVGPMTGSNAQPGAFGIGPSLVNRTSLQYSVRSPFSASAIYTHFYLVQITTPQGTSSEWLRAGSTLNLSAPASTGGFLSSSKFSGWTGTSSSSAPSFSLIVNSPIHESASYTTSLTGSYILAGALAIVGLLIGLAIGRVTSRSRAAKQGNLTTQAPPEPPASGPEPSGQPAPQEAPGQSGTGSAIASAQSG